MEPLSCSCQQWLAGFGFLLLWFGSGRSRQCFALGVATDLGMALLGTAPIDYVSHVLQHLDSEQGSFAELLTKKADGLLFSTQRKFWLSENAWFQEGAGDLSTLEWWTGCDLRDSARSTLVGLSAAVWCRLELKCP